MKEIMVLSDRKVRGNFCPVIDRNVDFSSKNVEKTGHSCSEYLKCGECTNKYARKAQA